jgi:hypothetical protein
MSKVQKPKKPTLSIQEISRSKALLKTIREQKRAGKIDIKSTFELIYVNFLPLLDNRQYVEEDLKELEAMLNSSADRMLAMIEKSKRQPVK